MGGKPVCPHCGATFPRFIRYAFSSWLFPLACRSCGARFYLGYHPAVFVVLWIFLSPLYLIALLYGAMLLLPDGFVIPGFLLAALASASLLPFIGSPRLKSKPLP